MAAHLPALVLAVEAVPNLRVARQRRDARRAARGKASANVVWHHCSYPARLSGVLARSTRGPQPCSIIINLSVWNRCLNGGFTSPETPVPEDIPSTRPPRKPRRRRHDGTCVTVWNGDLQVSHRLQENGFCLVSNLLETNTSSGLEAISLESTGW